MLVYTGTTNPLNKSKYSNKICFCGSGKKIKKCCGKDRFIKPKFLDVLAAYENVLLGNMPIVSFNHFANKFFKEIKDKE